MEAGQGKQGWGLHLARKDRVPQLRTGVHSPLPSGFPSQSRGSLPFLSLVTCSGSHRRTLQDPGGGAAFVFHSPSWWKIGNAFTVRTNRSMCYELVPHSSMLCKIMLFSFGRVTLTWVCFSPLPSPGLYSNPKAPCVWFCPKCPSQCPLTISLIVCLNARGKNIEVTSQGWQIRASVLNGCVILSSEALGSFSERCTCIWTQISCLPEDCCFKTFYLESNLDFLIQ